MARVFVSIGSNIDKERNVAEALERLGQHYGPLTCSSLYASPALGFDGPDFYNMVVAFDTDETPKDINGNLRRIEDALGRVRGENAFVSRTMDLDILLYDDWIMEEDLLLPREEILQHEFVLAPLAEICGDLCHPVTGETIEMHWQQWLAASTSCLRKILLPGTEAEVAAAIDR